MILMLVLWVLAGWIIAFKFFTEDSNEVTLSDAFGIFLMGLLLGPLGIFLFALSKMIDYFESRGPIILYRKCKHDWAEIPLSSSYNYKGKLEQKCFYTKCKKCNKHKRNGLRYYTFY